MSLAALLALMLGARANEILQHQARDVDDGAAILWIPYGKTESAKRRLTIPIALRPLVAKLVEGKPMVAELVRLASALSASEHEGPRAVLSV